MSEARRSIAARLLANVPGAIRDGTIGAIRFVLLCAVIGAAALGSALFVFREINPAGTPLMLVRTWEGHQIDNRWVPFRDIAPSLVHAVIASEDAGFCGHRGVDFAELNQAFELAQSRGEDVRGASTITMQVAKNLLLWPSRSYLRKGFEIPIALAMDRAWSKQRVLEVYLNVAEWGPGVFGIEAAARRFFRKPAARLTPAEAALLAVTLPAPRARNPSRPSPLMQRLARGIEARVRTTPRITRCVLTVVEAKQT
jgi:monofunctional biosynthetic peptidoglycan transglycosylase